MKRLTLSLAALLATPVVAQEMAGGQWGFYAGAFTAVNKAGTPTAAEARATTGPVTDVKE